jgi:Ca-activated chloride channel family protein
MNRDDRNPLNELSDGLRQAVEQVRSEPVPEDALARVLERAQSLPVRRPLPWARLDRYVLAFAGVAAMVLVAVAVWGTRSWQDATAEKQLSEVALASERQAREESELRVSMMGLTLLDESRSMVRFGRAPDNAPAHLDGLADRPNSEAYARIVENPFFAVDRQPLSTFSASVDTASYSIVRRFLTQEKRLPPSDAVRVAELINYFPYTYPVPALEHPVSITADVAECPWNTKNHLVRIGLMGKTLDPTKMPPRNFVFLIDTSGSMNETNRLPLFKAALGMLVEQLGERDRVGVVTYAGTPTVSLASTPASEKATIVRSIDKLYAEGSTNGGGGIVEAYRVAQENFIKGGINRVILGTDGDFNVGVTDPEELVKLIEEKKKGGVFLTILGFGMGNLKDATMEKLAYHGNGHYAYIDSLSEARKIFVEQGAALAAIAKDVKLQVEFNPRKVSGYRLIGYENRLLRDQDFNDDKRHAGSIGSGHTVTALYEVVPAGGEVPAAKVEPLKYQERLEPKKEVSDEYLTVRMRYKDPEADTSKLLEQALAGPVCKLADAPADFRFAAAVASFGQLLRKSEHRGDATYDKVRALADGARGNDVNGHRGEFVKLIDAAAMLARKADDVKQ